MSDYISLYGYCEAKKLKPHDSVTDKEYLECKNALEKFSNTQIGKGLKTLRERYNLSRVKLANRISDTVVNFSDKSIYKLETGNIMNENNVLIYTAIILKNLNQNVNYLVSLISNN